jgi:hypothetical protein
MKHTLLALIVAISAATTRAAPWEVAPPAGCATGQCPVVVPLAPPSDAHALPAAVRSAIVRVVHSQGASRALGSGTLVDVDGRQGLVVTCAHLFRQGTGDVQVVFPDGHTTSARVLRVDTSADLAALAIAAPRVEPVAVAQEFPECGDPLTSCGYGGDGKLSCNRGQALGYVSTVGAQGIEVLELSGSARFGDSGGPVFNVRYELVAVLFGTNGRVVDATFCGRVRRFLAGLSPRFSDSPRIAAKPPALPDANALPNAPPAIEPPRDSSETHRLARLEGLVAKLHDAWQGLSTRVERLGDAVKSVKDSVAGAARNGHAAPPNVERPLDVKPLDPIAEAVKPWLSAKLATVLISLGVPGGIAGVAAGAAVYFAMRRGKRRLQARLDALSRKSRDKNSVPEQPLSESTSNQSVVRHHNRYVPFEVTALDKAWAAAHAHIGEKYPGAVPYLKMAEGVKDQLLSGTNDPTIS